MQAKGPCKPSHAQEGAEGCAGQPGEKGARPKCNTPPPQRAVGILPVRQLASASGVPRFGRPPVCPPHRAALRRQQATAGHREGPTQRKRPARVDSLSGGPLGSHPPQRQGLLGPSAGQALTGQAGPPQPQGLLGPLVGQARPPSEMPPVPQQRANAKHPTTGITAGQQQTTRHSMHTSNSHGRIGSRPTFLCQVALLRCLRCASHLQQQPAGQAGQGGSRAEQAGARGRGG